MTLLLTILTGALFSSAEANKKVNSAMLNATAYWEEGEHEDRLLLMAGIFNVLAIIFTMSTISAAFTVWGIIAALSRRNAVMVLSTPIGLVSTQCPFYLLSIVIVLTFITTALYFRTMVPSGLFIFFLFVPVVIVILTGLMLALLARLVMHSGAMKSDDIDIKRRQHPSCLDDEQATLERWKTPEMWENYSAKGLQDQIFKRANRLRSERYSENTHPYATFVLKEVNVVVNGELRKLWRLTSEGL